MRTPHLRATRVLASVVVILAALVLGLAGSPSASAAGAHHAGHHAGHHAKHPRTSASTRAAQVLKLVNAARAQSRTCGTTTYKAVGPLKANNLLAKAARGFAKQLGTENFFDHVAPDGTDPGDRITAAGYQWRSYGENIAAGYDTPKQVVAGWLASEGHCANIMTAFKEVGIGYANVKSSTYGTYWVMDFGTR